MGLRDNFVPLNVEEGLPTQTSELRKGFVPLGEEPEPEVSSVPGTMLGAIQQMPAPVEEPTPEGPSVLGGIDKIGSKFDEVRDEVLRAFGDPKMWEKAGKEIVDQTIPSQERSLITMEGIQGATQLAEAARDPLGGFLKNEFQAVRGLRQIGEKVIKGPQAIDRAMTDWATTREPEAEALTWDWFKKMAADTPKVISYDLVQAMAVQIPAELATPILRYAKALHEGRRYSAGGGKLVERELLEDLGTAAYMILQGFAEFSIKPTPILGHLAYGHAAWKEAWAKDPATALVGMATILLPTMRQRGATKTMAEKSKSQSRGFEATEGHFEKIHEKNVQREIQEAVELFEETLAGPDPVVLKVRQEAEVATKEIQKQKVRQHPIEEIQRLVDIGAKAEGVHDLPPGIELVPGKATPKRVSGFIPDLAEGEVVSTRSVERRAKDRGSLGELGIDEFVGKVLSGNWYSLTPEQAIAGLKYKEGVAKKQEATESLKLYREAREKLEALSIDRTKAEIPKVEGYTQLRNGTLARPSGKPFPTRANALVAERKLRKAGFEYVVEKLDSGKYILRPERAAETASIAREMAEIDRILGKSEGRKKTQEELNAEWVLEDALRDETELGLSEVLPGPDPVASHPFDWSLEHTKTQQMELERVGPDHVKGNPHLRVNYFKTQANLWKHGEKVDAPIEEITDALRRSALEAKNASTNDAVLNRMPSQERLALAEDAAEAYSWAERMRWEKEKGDVGIVEMNLGLNLGSMIKNIWKRRKGQNPQLHVERFWEQLKPLVSHLPETDVTVLKSALGRLNDAVYMDINEVGKIAPWLEDRVRGRISIDILRGDKIELNVDARGSMASDYLTPVHEVAHSIYERLLLPSERAWLRTDSQMLDATTRKALERVSEVKLDTAHELFAEGVARHLGNDLTFDLFPAKTKEIVKQAVDNLTKPEPTKLYAGLPLNEMAQKARDVLDGMRNAKKSPLRSRIAKDTQRARKAFVDTQGNLKNHIEKWSKSIGESALGNHINNAIILARGGGASAADKVKLHKKVIYGGLGQVQRTALDDMVFGRRVIQIDKLEAARVAAGGKSRNIKHPGGVGAEGYQALFDKMRKEMGEAEFTKLWSRADAYFHAMRQQLKALYDEGLITEKSYNTMKTFDWQRREAIDVLDPVIHLDKFKTRMDVRDSGVESLKSGEITDVLETDSLRLLEEVIGRGEGRIYRNRANQAMAKLAREHPENPFIREKKPGDQWHEVKFYEKGKKKTYYMPRQWAKEWLLRESDISYTAAQTMRVVSGSSILRPMATGINPGFAFTNVLRDAAHFWAVGNYMDKGGNWKSVYNPITAPFQMGKDMSKVFTDTWTRSGKYSDMIADGGGQEFLTQQGSVLEHRMGHHRPLEGIQNALGFLNMFSELLMRNTFRERAVERIAKREGLTKDQIHNDRKYIMFRREATAISRDYLDFGQGGSLTKAADAGIPYLNASAQATRGIFKTASRNPQGAMAKAGILGATASALYLAQRKMAPEWLKDVSQDDLRRNWTFPIFGDHYFTDKDGQKRYIYLKVPKDQGQQFFATAASYLTARFMGDDIPEPAQIVKSLKELSPADMTTMPPTMSAAVAYFLNVDTWSGEPVWKGPKVEASEEYRESTPGYAVKAGQLTGMSPDRLHAAMEEVFTRGNAYTYPVGYVSNKLMKDMPEDLREEHMAMWLSQAPIAKRFIGVTNPYGEYRGMVDEVSEGVATENWKATRSFDVMLKAYYDYGNMEKKDLKNYLKSQSDPAVRDRLVDRWKFFRQVRGLEERTLWLRMHAKNPEERARIFHNIWKDADEEQKDVIKKEIAQVPGIITDEFKRYYGQLRGQ